MVTLRAVDPNLESAGHVTLHGFPVTATGELLRRAGCHCNKNGTHGRANLHRVRVQRFPAGGALSRIVGLVPSKEHDIVYVIRGWARADRRGNLAGSRGLFAPRMGIRSHDCQRLADTRQDPVSPTSPQSGGASIRETWAARGILAHTATTLLICRSTAMVGSMLHSFRVVAGRRIDLLTVHAPSRVGSGRPRRSRGDASG